MLSHVTVTVTIVNIVVIIYYAIHYAFVSSRLVSSRLVSFRLVSFRLLCFALRCFALLCTVLDELLCVFIFPYRLTILLPAPNYCKAFIGLSHLQKRCSRPVSIYQTVDVSAASGPCNILKIVVGVLEQPCEETVSNQDSLRSMSKDRREAQVEICYSRYSSNSNRICVYTDSP